MQNLMVAEDLRRGRCKGSMHASYSRAIAPATVQERLFWTPLTSCTSQLFGLTDCQVLKFKRQSQVGNRASILGVGFPEFCPYNKQACHSKVSFVLVVAWL